MKVMKAVSGVLGKCVKIPVLGITPIGGIVAAGAYMLYVAIDGYIREERMEKAIKSAVQDEILDLLKKMNESN